MCFPIPGIQCPAYDSPKIWKSFDAYFVEIGPYEISCEEKNGTSVCSEKARDHSWNNQVHLLVVDQPVGTGFSYGKTEELVNSTEQAAEYLYNGLVSLF